MREITCTCDRCGEAIKDGVVYTLTCYAEKVDPKLHESTDMSREIWEQNSMQNMMLRQESKRDLCKACKDYLTEGIFIV